MSFLLLCPKCNWSGGINDCQHDPDHSVKVIQVKNPPIFEKGDPITVGRCPMCDYKLFVIDHYSDDIHYNEENIT